MVAGWSSSASSIENTAIQTSKSCHRCGNCTPAPGFDAPSSSASCVGIGVKPIISSGTRSLTVPSHSVVVPRSAASSSLSGTITSEASVEGGGTACAHNCHMQHSNSTRRETKDIIICAYPFDADSSFWVGLSRILSLRVMRSHAQLTHEADRSDQPLVE